jgi:hypothetical protein
LKISRHVFLEEEGHEKEALFFYTTSMAVLETHPPVEKVLRHFLLVSHMKWRKRGSLLRNWHLGSSGNIS